MNNSHKNSPLIEVNFDGLVGPTHNYSGLSPDNVACQTHKGSPSHPKAAALQGLEKMRFVQKLGIKQAILPPHPRPNLNFLKNLGHPSPKDELTHIQNASPHLLAAAYSASAMWTANAATVSPSTDTADQKLHLTPANLLSELHRSLEPIHTHKILKSIFNNTNLFTVHPPLPSAKPLSDEGAANHTRLSNGTHIFTYGVNIGRQSLQASQSIARLHQLDPQKCIFLKQNPQAIQAGVFHNDVIAVGNNNTYFYHQLAYTEDIKPLLPGVELIEVPNSAVSLETAVKTYLFNSQLLTLPDGSTALVAPKECQENPDTAKYLKTFPHKVHFIDVRESMKNGGGPACLRLRVPMTQNQIDAINPSVFLTDKIYEDLKLLINTRYRDEIHPTDLSNPSLIDESLTTTNQIYEILNLHL